MKTLAIFTFLLCTSVFAEVINNIDLDKVELELKEQGAVGFVHGSVPAYGHFVFTYRDPNNFFNFLEFSMVPMNDEVKEAFSTLKRHDKVRLFGKFSKKNPSAFKHIYVEKLEMVKKYVSPIAVPPYHHALDIPKELEGKSSFIGKIHAIAYDNKVLVAEYKDTVLPLFTENPEKLAHLFREDTVEIFFKIIPARGKKPMHLEVDDSRAEPVKVLIPIAEGHGAPVTLSGELIMFPQSPQILFNVFAIRVVDRLGIDRNYTVINFDDAELFRQVREKLQKIWDENLNTAVGFRNAWINPKVRLEISGTKNVVSPAQANPQIVVDSVDSIVLK